MNSPVNVPVVPVVPNEVKPKGRGRKAKVVEEKVTHEVSADKVDEKPKAKGRAKKVSDAPLDPDAAPLDPDAPKPRKNLIAKHALLHSFTFFLAKQSLDAGILDQSSFLAFLHKFLFFQDSSSLSNFFQNLDLKTLLKDSKNAVKTYAKEQNAKTKRQPKAKKEKAAKDTDPDAPTDLISTLVSLANSKEPVAHPSSPVNTLKNAEVAPDAPVKQKRKYSKKPKVEAIDPALAADEEA